VRFAPQPSSFNNIFGEQGQGDISYSAKPVMQHVHNGQTVSDPIEIRQALAGPLGWFFRAQVQRGVDRLYRPHAFVKRITAFLIIASRFDYDKCREIFAEAAFLPNFQRQYGKPPKVSLSVASRDKLYDSASPEPGHKVKAHEFLGGRVRLCEVR